MMASMEGVVDVAAVLQDAGTPTAAIVGYVAPAASASDAVMAACRARLPHYMCPSAVVGLEVMPRLANGKVRLGCAVAKAGMLSALRRACLTQLGFSMSHEHCVQTTVSGQPDGRTTPRVHLHGRIRCASKRSGGSGARCLADGAAAGR